MALSKDERLSIVKEFQLNEKDTGSVEVQVALLTNEINYLNVHFKLHPKDHHSKRGLFLKVGQRRRLLNYLKREDSQRYQVLIQKLKLRK